MFFTFMFSKKLCDIKGESEKADYILLSLKSCYSFIPNIFK